MHAATEGPDEEGRGCPAGFEPTSCLNRCCTPTVSRSKANGGDIAVAAVVRSTLGNATIRARASALSQRTRALRPRSPLRMAADEIEKTVHLVRLNGGARDRGPSMGPAQRNNN